MEICFQKYIKVNEIKVFVFYIGYFVFEKILIMKNAFSCSFKICEILSNKMSPDISKLFFSKLVDKVVCLLKEKKELA